MNINESAEIRLDSRGRTNLSPLGQGTRNQTYKARMDENGVIYLEPARLVPANTTATTPKENA